MAIAATSRAGRGAARTERCYVHIQLPGTLEVVPCGVVERRTLPAGGVLGRFAYARSYLARRDALAIDPIHLPLRPGAQETAKLGGVFGAIRDAAPDAWGQYVIERKLGRFDLTVIDLLLHSPEDRIGALSFGRTPDPPAPVWTFNRVLALPDLLAAAARVEADRAADAPVPAPDDVQVHQLLEHGTSALGGARPKNVVVDEAGMWVAKFPSRADRWNVSVAEAAMLTLARRCGMRTPEVRVERVGSRDVLLVKRFDRERTEDSRGNTAYFRHRMVSALTVLDAEDAVTDRRAWSYVMLAEELQRWSARPLDDKRELFARMVFNALVSNLDDHPRNHALVAAGRDFRLSPAYDITPDPVHAVDRRDLAMECGRFGRIARRDNLLSESPRFGLASSDAARIIDDMQAIVRASWESTVRRLGGTIADCDAIRRAFAYPGFEYPTTPEQAPAP